MTRTPVVRSSSIPRNPEDLCFLPARDLVQAIRAKTISPVEVFDAMASRIEAVNPRLNAYCTLDLDRARALSHIAKEAIAHNKDLGPLYGVPVAIKDDLGVKGLRITAGSRLLENLVAEKDDLTVARL